MNIQDLIEDLLSELSYQSLTGVPDLKDRKTIGQIYEYFNSIGLGEVGQELINNLLSEAPNQPLSQDKKFKNPQLNKVVQYKDKDGNDKEGLVGNLLRLGTDQPGREAAERALSGLSDEEREDLNKELGDEGGGGEETPQPTSQGGDQPQTQQGTAVNPDTEGGKSFTDQLSPSDPAYTGQPTEKKTEVNITNFSQKSEATEGLFAGPKEYKTIQIGDKSATVRPMIDPSSGISLDTSNPEDRQRAITVLDERLKSLEEKGQWGINRLEESDVPKTERTAILKWLGEVGELQAYRSFLQSDKVKDVYMLTDSEPKNDLVIIGESEERNVFLQGISVKTTKVNQQANRRGSSVKPDLESGLDSAPTRKVSIEGVDEDVDASVLMNSFIEIRKRIIKELSNGKVRQNPQTKESEVVLENGEVVSITEYFRREQVTEEVINKIFGDDSIFSGRFNPIRTLTDDSVDENQSTQLREHFRKEFLNMLSDGNITIDDMQEKIVDNFIQIYDNIGANITPATDMMISYYGEDGFKENKIIAKEDSEQKIMEVLGVDNFSEIDKKTQFKTVLGLDWTGRGMGKKKEGTGFIDGQSFGRPSPKLYPTPRNMEDYIENVIK
jgi:hypothetical protein